ncbi:C40 family peptidase [Actinopolyspora sp. BKK1]|nr:C40 family peptidase [Actinopolyspora sp. BKK2]NHE77189.1 C40 family peptidase [Actinopolyspora sp. BKK1]
MRGIKRPNRFNCSGLMQWSCEQVGISLSASTRIQAGAERAASQLRPGDVLFYCSSPGHNGCTSATASSYTSRPGDRRSKWRTSWAQVPSPAPSQGRMTLRRQAPNLLTTGYGASRSASALACPRG